MSKRRSSGAADPGGEVVSRLLRIPADLNADLREYAAQTHRSANAAAVWLIERGLRAAVESGEYTPGPRQQDGPR